MSDQIIFNLILNKNLGLKWFAMKQIEVQIEVEDAGSPLVHQEMRDYASDVFKKHQRKINSEVEQIDKWMAKLTTARSRREYLARSMRTLERMTGKFEDEMKRCLDEFCRKLKKESKEADSSEDASLVSYALHCVYAWPKIAKKTMKIIEAAAQVAAGEVTAALEVASNVYKVYGKVQKEYDNLWDSFVSEETFRTYIQNATKQLKSGATEDDVAYLQKQLDAYEERVLQTKVSLRKTSEKLEEVERYAPTNEDFNDEAIAEAERVANEVIEQVTAGSEVVTQAEQFIKEYRLKLAVKKAGAKKSTQSWGEWALETYAWAKKFKPFLTMDTKKISKKHEKAQFKEVLDMFSSKRCLRSFV